MNLLTTTQAAECLNITVRGVQKLIGAGTIKATRTGRDWLIPERELKRAEKRPGRGRPRKTKGGK